jgi:hypothetical protein
MKDFSNDTIKRDVFAISCIYVVIEMWLFYFFWKGFSSSGNAFLRFQLIALQVHEKKQEDSSILVMFFLVI